MAEIIPYGKPFIAGRELEYIARAVDLGHLSGDGRFTELCQRWFIERLGCRHALLTHSCTAALELAAIAAGIGQGDEVIMPSFTFVSTANAFVLRGARPVFVDIRADTLNLDETLVAAAVTDRTRAIVPMHYGGVACEMDLIADTARHNGLLIIEDAAHALLATYKGRQLGTVGELGCLSFHDTKNVICGEGGALLFRDANLVERAEIAREKGTNRKAFFRGEVDKYSWVDIGSSYLPGELTAAFLYAQLEHAEEILARRRALCLAYRERLAPLEDEGLLSLPDTRASSHDAGHIFYLLARSPREREALRRHLRSEEIHAVTHYVPLHSSVAGRRFGRAARALPVTDRVAETLLRLPLFYQITESQLDRVAESITRFYKAAG
ncbi:MAG TPA: dTDP-4-amino-4,6-dideoxygalactose transaminase [Burkholderiales bacterium]|nr:dTDP-4-amino-4,6-dideoxygalactose transaminase [Burkholderiales bacterium]